MKSVAGAVVFTVAFVVSGWAQVATMWQTTHNGWSTGQCQLVANSVRMKVYPFHVDVEEEAVIAPIGTVGWGDAATLEITGQFTLSPGSAVRSMLLWEGNRILKAKLRDRRAADSLYEEVVDRQNPQAVVRDPALIEYVGPNTYRFKIYPVAAGASRKIRILYSVPCRVDLSAGPTFTIQTAFTAGPQQAPTKIPFEIRRDSSVSGSFIMQSGSVLRTVVFGAVYQIDYTDLVSRLYSWQAASPRPIQLIPDSFSWDRAYTARIPEGPAAGYYLAVVAKTPADVLDAVHSSGLYNPTVEVRVSTGERVYIGDLNSTGFVGVYMKTPQAWDSVLTWACYNSRGTAVIEYEQRIVPVGSSQIDQNLPLFWAAKYSLGEGRESLGALYGFIDQRMSLLALESDALAADLAAQYQLSGVPLLLKADIVIDPSQIPVTPVENVMFESQNTSVLARNAVADAVRVQLAGDGAILISFGAHLDGTFEAAMYDIGGRLVKDWVALEAVGGAARLNVPRGLRGTFVVRVRMGGTLIQKQIVLK